MSIFPPRGLYLTLFFQLESESTSRGSVQTASLQCPASSKHTVHCEVPKLAKLFLHRVLCIYLSNNFKPHVFLSISPSHRLKFISLSISCAYNCSSNDDLCSYVMAHLPKHCHRGNLTSQCSKIHHCQNAFSKFLVFHGCLVGMAHGDLGEISFQPSFSTYGKMRKAIPAQLECPHLFQLH